MEVKLCPACGSKKAEFYQEHTHIFKVICRVCKYYFIIWARPTGRGD